MSCSFIHKQQEHQAKGRLHTHTAAELLQRQSKQRHPEMKAVKTHFHFSKSLFYVHFSFVIFYTGHACCVILGTSCLRWFCLLLWFHDLISGGKWKASHWVLFLYATIIAGVVETFPFVWTPPSVIKVPLCISSPPSLSENLSCPLMGVCWWVWLIVGFCKMSFVPAVTLIPIVWSSPARLSRLSFSQSDGSIRANWLCKLFLGKGIFLKLY